MRLGIIGTGAIGRFVYDELLKRGFSMRALLVRAGRVLELGAQFPNVRCVATVADLPTDIDHVIDCAGHSALRTHGPDILRRGIDLTTVSLGALADSDLYQTLDEAAAAGNAVFTLASGAVGGLDCLRAARVGTLRTVTYTGRKPPAGWKGSPAEQQLDLDALVDEAHVHFSGTAREAATQYPKNANVAAAVAIAGIGFDATRVELIADPNVDQNVHHIAASGDFGDFSFVLRGNALPSNPKSSALAAMSVVSQLAQASQRIRF
ncbi:MAG: aspartate dehydrogenase [Pseudomonadota bacterium]